MSVTAIETRYAGCRFRSRLEARWAVFFDKMRIDWQYEPQGYRLNRPYLPDFWLPKQQMFFEVKGTAPGQDYGRRLALLAEQSRCRVVIAIGDIPRPNAYQISCDPPFYMEVYQGPHSDNCQAWCICPLCDAVDVQFMGRAERNCDCWPDGERIAGNYDPTIQKAYAAARSARFEYGEVGA